MSGSIESLERSLRATDGCVNDHDAICECRPVDVRAAITELEKARADAAAIARLEAWHAECPEGRTYRCRKITTGGCLVELQKGKGQYEVCYRAVDRADVPGYPPGHRATLAAGPGLAATINAALDKAEERKA